MIIKSNIIYLECSVGSVCTVMVWYGFVCHRLAIYRHLVPVIAIFDNIFIIEKSVRIGFACHFDTVCGKKKAF